MCTKPDMCNLCIDLLFQMKPCAPVRDLVLALKESDRRLGKLIKTSVESKTAIRSGVLELESAGYISMLNGKITVLEVDDNANL